MFCFEFICVPYHVSGSVFVMCISARVNYCTYWDLSGNNVPGITSHFGTQDGQVASQVKSCVADFVHTQHLRVYNDFVTEKSDNLKIAVHILNNRD